jgi:hypothetical protein
VIKVEVDRSGLLKPGQWSFSLKLSEGWKEEMHYNKVHTQWSRGTWRVFLAKDDEKDLWKLVAGWEPSV